MPRLLAIDYGAKRTGIAVTDPLKIIATALDTVPTHQLPDFLKKYMLAEEVEAFVVGMPKKLDNTDSENAARVTAFVKTLQKAFPEIPVHLHDERFTSSMALQSMIASGSKKVTGAIRAISTKLAPRSFFSPSWKAEGRICK